MIKVQGYSNLYRDEKSGAIVNSNVSDYKRRLTFIKQDRIRKNELDQMKSDINELKDLMKALLEKTTS
tara:strand:- start:1115 stop:1318 length:204 start_codon:yes stop_codon:yes gene_type:complete